MKKLFILLCTVCMMPLSLGLTACGTTYAKVTGVCAGIGTEQIDPFVYGSSLCDGETVTENDYILQAGKNYILGVALAQSGGSIICSVNNEYVSLKYDNEALQIAYSHNEGEVAIYTLTCKKVIAYTAVIIEVDDYACTVIISAK